MIIHPTLYARTNTGAVQTWYIAQDGREYRSVFGQQFGEQTESAPTIALPKNVGKKNETSAEYQADLEVKAKYDKQLKSGGYSRLISDIDTPKFFQPMLAKNYKDYSDKLEISNGVGVQIKYNGGRIVARRTGLFSRKGEQYMTIPHIEEGLQPFFAAYPDAILDGEGFNYGLRERLNEIMELLRKYKHYTAEDLAKSKELIKFYIYDGFGVPLRGKLNIRSDMGDGYLQRKDAIDACPLLSDRVIFPHVQTWIVKSQDELNGLYNTFLDDKQEGAIIRVLDSPYEDKRSKYLLKYKPVDDAEYKVLSIQDGNGNDANRASTATCQRIDGKFFADGTDTFNASFIGGDDLTIRFWDERADWVGKIFTVYYNGLTGKAKPNYARIDLNNCFKN